MSDAAAPTGKGNAAMLSAPSGALQDLRPLEAGDLTGFKAAVEAGQQTGWAYYLPYLLAKHRPGRSLVLLTGDGGSLCMFQWKVAGDRPRLDLLFPPIPMQRAALARALERANDINRDRSARILRIDDRDAEHVASLPSLQVKQRRLQYLFAPGTYRDLAGKQCYTIRRNVALVERLPDVQVVPYVPAHAEGCRALLAQWQRTHRDAHGTAGGVGASQSVIALAGALPERDLRGEVVLIDGRVAAFAFGGEIRPGLACSFERKCDTEVRGLSYFHFRSFLLRLGDFERVNDGSDANRPGLRQLKESFRPIAMHSEHRATQQPSP